MKIRCGDILSVKEGIIVSGCNAQGIMGRGVARQIRDIYPSAYESYRDTYVAQGNKLYLGQVIYVSVTPALTIANAITQNNFGNDGKLYVSYDAIKVCFDGIGALAYSLQEPVHYPMIGAGLGGGDWNIISSIINESLKDVEHYLWKL